MSDLELIHRPALRSARPVSTPRIRLAPLPEGTVLQVFGPSAGRARLAEAADSAGLSLHDNGFEQWFLVGDAPVPPLSLPAGYSCVDQSHGRVRIAIGGAAVEDVLAKGTGLDLAAIPVGAAAPTLFGHVAVHLTRTGADAFHVLVLRGFAESLWDDLLQHANEYL